MTTPELAELTIEPDGQPQQLQLPAAQSVGVDSAWIAMTESLLAVSVSDDAETALPALLQADSATPPPFISVGFDAGRYYSMLGEAILEAEDDSMPADMQTAVSDILVAAGGFYEFLQVDVKFTSRGIEISADMKLAD